MEQIIMDYVAPYIAPAIFINIVADIFKRRLQKKIKNINSYSYMIIVVFSIAYSFLLNHFDNDMSEKDLLNQITFISGVSSFVYMINLFDFIKNKFGVKK